MHKVTLISGSLAFTLLLTASACRSNQETIQQSVSNLSTQSRQVAATPQPGTSPWGVFATGAAVMLFVVAVMVAVVLYRNWRSAVEKAAHDKASAEYKVREAQMRARMQSQPPAPPTAYGQTPPQIAPYAVQPPAHPLHNPEAFS